MCRLNSVVIVGPWLDIFSWHYGDKHSCQVIINANISILVVNSLIEDWAPRCCTSIRIYQLLCDVTRTFIEKNNLLSLFSSSMLIFTRKKLLFKSCYLLCSFLFTLSECKYIKFNMQVELFTSIADVNHTDLTESVSILTGRYKFQWGSLVANKIIRGRCLSLLSTSMKLDSMLLSF